MRDLTICLPYYINAGMLAAQYAHLAALPADLQRSLRLIVVDDGSPRDPAAAPAAPFGVAVEIYRIIVDVRWNQDAARNLAVAQAKTEWLLLTDIDHVPSRGALEWLTTTKKLRSDTVYRFGQRLDAPDLTPKIKNGAMHPHPNSWVMTSAMYEAIGGYDEALAGNYGTDGDFARRAKAHAPLVELALALVRYPREVIADASTTTLERKNPHDKVVMREIMHRRGPGWRPLRGSFPWVQVHPAPVA